MIGGGPGACLAGEADGYSGERRVGGVDLVDGVEWFLALMSYGMIAGGMAIFSNVAPVSGVLLH